MILSTHYFHCRITQYGLDDGRIVSTPVHFIKTDFGNLHWFQFLN